MRTRFCDVQALSEEDVPLRALSAFYVRHERHAQLVLKCPGCRLLKDEVPRLAVETFANGLAEQLPDSAYSCISVNSSYERACVLAEEASLIVWPKQESDACVVSAYAMTVCRQRFECVCWASSCLTSAQRSSHSTV